MTVPRISFKKDSSAVHFFPNFPASTKRDTIETGLQKILIPDPQYDSLLIYNIGRADLVINLLPISNALFTSNFDSLKDTLQNAVVITSYDSIWVHVYFNPIVIAEAFGTLNPIANDTTFHTIINLHGTGVDPDLTVIPSLFNFGLVSVGSLDSTTIGIKNTGHNQGGIESDLVLAFGIHGAAASEL